MSEFEENYYASNNYSDYMQRGDRYLRTADEIVQQLEILGLNKEGLICDFGCAVGFLSAGLKSVQKNPVYGVDVSEYARGVCERKGITAHKEISDCQHSVVFSLDVFEHLANFDLQELFSKLKTECIVFRMPVVINSGEDYPLAVSRADPTHKIRWTKDEWRSFFKEYGFMSLDLNLHTIYNSDGVYTGIAIKL